MEIIALVASIASIVLAVVAIVLSAFFYRMTKDSSEKARDASRDISSGVEKLEKLFDRMYADTFGMMKDTVSDMRQHMWPTSERIDKDNLEEEENENKLNNLKDELIMEFMEKIGGVEEKNEENMTILRKELDEVVSRTIDGTRIIENEASEAYLRSDIIGAINSRIGRDGIAKAAAIVERAGVIHGPIDVIKELYDMYTKDEIFSVERLRSYHDITPDTSFIITRDVRHPIRVKDKETP